MRWRIFSFLVPSSYYLFLVYTTELLFELAQGPSRVLKVTIHVDFGTTQIQGNHQLWCAGIRYTVLVSPELM